ncbi:MAG: hypothetical protein KAR40_13145 [Candidatus Sabulitectum sp.]|nr:hypothetical protein [Candidatus Sabulitectum sp.]
MKKSMQTFDCFKHDLTGILGGNLFEIIIHGSYVLDDFRPNLGDLDYMVVTNENLDEAMNTRLFELHDQYRSERMLLLHQLEGTFYPKHFLRELSLPFTGCYIGTSQTGWRTITSFQNSFMDLRLINEHGMYLLGKNPKIYNPVDSQILKEQISGLDAFVTSAATAKSRGIGLWMVIVHWCSRTIFYHSTGRIGSKTEACRWCAERPELEPFRGLFKNAESRRYPFGEEVLSISTRTACIALLKFTKKFLLSFVKQFSSIGIHKG